MYALLHALALGQTGCVRTLFFSEYAEGSSNNKFLEIYNPTGATVSLDGFGFPNSNNGGTGAHEYWNTFTAGATIAAGATYVICHPSSDASILAMCQQQFTYLSNGDDGYCIAQGTETNHVLVDCVGDFGPDPGSGWDVCGAPAATRDQTLVRKASVGTGNAGDWSSSAGTSATDCEWTLYPQNTWTYLGAHVIHGGAGCANAGTPPSAPTPPPAPSHLSSHPSMPPVPPSPPGQTGCVRTLFFSEYAEGSSNNKFLEIYNPTGATVSLDGFGFPNSNNGGTGAHEYWNTFTAGATIAAGATYVICHPSSDASILAMCQQQFTYLSNGDDGYCIAQGTETNHVLVDCVGDFGPDPGSGWDVCGAPAATRDQTLVRKASVGTGNAGDWSSSAGTSATDCEWTLYPQNTWTYLGAHVIHGGAGCANAGTPPPAPSHLPSHPSMPPVPPSPPRPPRGPAPAGSTSMSLHQINFVPASSDACASSTSAGMVVHTQGYVSAVKQNGFYMQENPAGSLWGGIWVYFSSSSDRSGLAGRAIGDLVSVTSTVTEYYDLTELENPISVTLMSTGHTLTPMAITTGALGTACTRSGEQYEGLLVTVGNVMVHGAPNQYGEIPIDDGSGQTQLEDGILDTDAHLMAVLGVSNAAGLQGTILPAVTGIVHYSYGSFELHPRFAADIYVGTLEPPPPSPSPSPPAASPPPPLPGVLFLETFDTPNSFSIVDSASVSTPFMTDGYNDYLGIDKGPSLSYFGGMPPLSTSGTDDPPAGIKTYTGFVSGGGVFKVMDADADISASTGVRHQEPWTITWHEFSVATCTSGLQFSGKFAANAESNSRFDYTDYVSVMASMDGGPPLTLLTMRGCTSTQDPPDPYNEAFCFDPDNNPNNGGGGHQITGTAQTITAAIPSGGSMMTLSVVLALDAGDEDFAMDDLQVMCTGAAASPAASPPPAATMTLSQINSVPASSDACATSTSAGIVVQTQGYVSAVLNNGFYMQENPAGSLFGGIWVYFSSSSDRSGLAGRAIGDLVSVTSTVTEYYDLTELENPISVTLMSTGHTLTPMAITTGALGTACTRSGEQYEGLLVTVSNAMVTSEANQYGEISIDDGSGQTQLEDGIVNTDQHLQDLVGATGTIVGANLISLTGVVRYAFSSFEIHPRTAADIVVANMPPFPPPPPPTSSPPPPPPLPAWDGYRTVVTLLASGDVNDYTPSVVSTIVANFARAAAVPPSVVRVVVTSASVRVEVTIASATRDAADTVQRTLAPSLRSTTSATALMPAGLTVVEAPSSLVVALQPAPIGAGSDSGPDPAVLAAIIGVLVALLLVALVGMHFMFKRVKATPPSAVLSNAVPVEMAVPSAATVSSTTPSGMEMHDKL